MNIVITLRVCLNLVKRIESPFDSSRYLWKLPVRISLRELKVYAETPAKSTLILTLNLVKRIERTLPSLMRL